MAAIIGMVIGAAIVLRLFSLLFEWAIFKRVMDDPLAGKVTSLFAAWVLVTLILASGAVLMRGGAILIFGATALMLLPFAMRSGFKVRRRIADEHGLHADLEDTFSYGAVGCPDAFLDRRPPGRISPRRHRIAP